jgi:hypothetical protein
LRSSCRPPATHASPLAGKVQLVNTLGLKGEGQELYSKLEMGTLSQDDVDPRCTKVASEHSYGDAVCSCDGHAGKAVARCNASTAGPPPNRSEGKVSPTSFGGRGRAVGRCVPCWRWDPLQG